MKKYIILLLTIFAFEGNAQTNDHFTGEWRTDDNTVVEIYVKDSAYYAKAKNEGNRDVLVQMEKRSANRLYGGTYFDGESQSEYEAKVTLTNRNTIRIKMLVGVFHKTIIWRRIASEKTNPVAATQ